MSTASLNEKQTEKLTELCRTLIDQEKARTIVPPMKSSTGFWFGGGSMISGPDGELYLSGRYRNYGDSRTGLGVGERGLELAVFESTDQGKSFRKIKSFSKADLGYGEYTVLSIEGTALHRVRGGIELYLSTEKDGVGYPEEVADYQKPGTGVWSIDRIKAPSVESLSSENIEPVLSCRDPRFLHVKDPVLYRDDAGDSVMVFCTHPFNWASSNSGFALRSSDDGVFGDPNFTFFPRGFTWDTGISRITGRLRVPAVGVFEDVPPVDIYFYDGGESMRNLDEHEKAIKRPRGYSCEEIGGAAYTVSEDLRNLTRLSVIGPLFTSPWGTGCSRYVQCHVDTKRVYMTWEQSQDDLSQPLVMNTISLDTIRELLS